MTDDELKFAEAAAAKAHAAGDAAAVSRAIAPLIAAQADQREAALVLLDVISAGHLTRPQALEVLTSIATSHPTDVQIIAFIGECIEEASEIDELNRPPPNDPLFNDVVQTLSSAAERVRGEEFEIVLMSGLATSARMMARQYDDVADKAYKRLVELQPENSAAHYGYGLYLKTRGRLADGLAQNQRAAELAKKPSEAILWNLGICATGAGQGEIALQTWKQIGNKLQMGRFGLPEGKYHATKVQLCERPLAERGHNHDDPGLEETIWIERLSPCHGIVRSVLYQDIGVDYGDVVLIDGAPVTYHRYGEDSIPVFPHLATLQHRRFQFFDFAGIQSAPRQLANLSPKLSDEAIIYSYTESYRLLCKACWLDPSINHQHEDVLTENVVRGRIAAPPELEPKALLAQIEAAIAGETGCQIFSPALCMAAGLTDRAASEQQKFDLLDHSGAAQ